MDIHGEFTKKIKLILKTQQRFMKWFDEKGIRSTDTIETDAQRAIEDLMCKKKEIKCNNIIKQ